MHELFTEMLEVMDAAFRKFEAMVPKPVWVPEDRRFRFKEQSIPQALIQKLARVQSALRASQLLLLHGYTMELGILHRAVDETNEDIEFLVCAITNDRITPLHERYLRSFWAEEFGDQKDPGRTHQSRDMVMRKNIRAYNTRILGDGLSPSEGLRAARVISKAFSGFVHGASPHIMESFGGNPPKFHTRGLRGSPRIPEYTRSLWNYMYRGLQSHIFVAKAFGAVSVFEGLQKHKKQFEALVGVDYSARPRASRPTTR